MASRIDPVLAAVRQQVETLGFTLEGVALPVLIRRAAHRRQTLDPRAMITVAKSGTPEQTSRRRFGLWQTAYQQSYDRGASKDVARDFADRVITAAVAAQPIKP